MHIHTRTIAGEIFKVQSYFVYLVDIFIFFTLLTRNYCSLWYWNAVKNRISFCRPMDCNVHYFNHWTAVKTIFFLRYFLHYFFFHFSVFFLFFRRALAIFLTIGLRRVCWHSLVFCSLQSSQREISHQFVVLKASSVSDEGQPAYS